MIGFEKEPTGRMGNVLIQYAFLRQLAEKCGVDYFHPKLPYEKYFKEFKTKRRPVSEYFKKKWIVSNRYIEEIGVGRFIEEVRSKENYSIILKPPVLGHLLEWENENQMRFVQIKEEYGINDKKTDSNGIKKVGIHFRGTDFKEWDSNAVLDSGYYKRAIDFIQENAEYADAKFFLYTDDNDFETYKDTLAYLQDCKLKYEPGDANRPMMDDFIGLSECDVIVSSPSTFAICAALMGKENKMIIHSKNWVNYCVERGEKFWKSVLDNSNQFYVTHVM